MSLSLKELNKKLADSKLTPLEKKRLQEQYNKARRRARNIQDPR